MISRLAGTVVVLRSEARGGHGVTFPMRCRNGTRDALGTSVTIEAGGRKQRALVHSGVTYLSQCDRRIHSGLGAAAWAVSYTHLRAHETPEHLVCRLLLEKKKKKTENKNRVIRNYNKHTQHVEIRN